MSLALATLIYEWRRYLAAVIALAFAGLLILAVSGMMTGIVRGATATIDRSRADLMVLPPKSESLINSGPASLPRRIAPQVYLNPQVAQVGSFDGGGGRWTNSPGPGVKQVTTFIGVNMVDTELEAVTLPVDFSETTRIALMEPGAVAIDRTALARLGVKLDDTAMINGKTVHVRAILDGYPDVNNVSVTVSRDTLRRLGMLEKGEKVGPLMVRLRDPAKAEAVRDELNAQAHGAYRAWTRAELGKANESALMKEQIVGILLGFLVFVGFLIGVGITSQTLRGAILADIKEFATLRALGISMGSLRLIVIELSFWVGAVGLIATGFFTWGVYLLGKSAGVPMGFPIPYVVGVSVMLMVISIASGLMAMGILKKSQPADLLR
jgi:putative ABC transport system permease protein